MMVLGIRLKGYGPLVPWTHQLNTSQIGSLPSQIEGLETSGDPQITENPYSKGSQNGVKYGQIGVPTPQNRPILDPSGQVLTTS